MQTTGIPFDYAARTSLAIGQYFLIVLGPVLGRLININPGLKFVPFLYFTFLCIAKSNFCVIITVL